MNKELSEEELKEAYNEYARSHERFEDGWLLVTPMEHSYETFVEICRKNKKYYQTFKPKGNYRSQN
jgi:hypothetical protein